MLTALETGLGLYYPSVVLLQWKARWSLLPEVVWSVAQYVRRMHRLKTACSGHSTSFRRHHFQQPLELQLDNPEHPLATPILQRDVLHINLPTVNVGNRTYMHSWYPANYRATPFAIVESGRRSRQTSACDWAFSAHAQVPKLLVTLRMFGRSDHTIYAMHAMHAMPTAEQRST